MKTDRHRDRRENKHQKENYVHHRGAKTFRRGRAITFLERMDLKRSTIKKQLETPELQTINPILVGELKAIDMVIEEFVELFELYEFKKRNIEIKQTGEMKDSLLISEVEKERINFKNKGYGK